MQNQLNRITHTNHNPGEKISQRDYIDSQENEMIVPNMMSRREILKRCFAKTSISYRKNYTSAQIDDLVTVSQETLAVIPTEKLEEVFAIDFQTRTGIRSFPSDRDLLTAYSIIREKEKTKNEWNSENKPYIHPNTMYTIKNLPWCYISHRNRYLVENKDKLSQNERYEYDNLLTMEFRREDLCLNENVKMCVDEVDKHPYHMVKKETMDRAKELFSSKRYNFN